MNSKTPETTTKSKIKPKINQKIEEMFSWSSTRFEEKIEDSVIPMISTGEKQDLYPQFNDMDMRVHMMKSLGLEKLPEIKPNSVDESSGIIGKTSTFFKKYDLEKLLEDARKR